MPARSLRALVAVAAMTVVAAPAALADVSTYEDDCATVVAVAPGGGAPGVFVSAHTDSPDVFVYGDNGDGELDRGTGEGEFDETTLTGNPDCAGGGTDDQMY